MLFIPDSRIQRGALGRDLSAWFSVDPGPNLLNQGNGVTADGTAYKTRATINNSYPGGVDDDGYWDQSINLSWGNLGGSDDDIDPYITFGADVEVLASTNATQSFLLRGADTGSYATGFGWGFQLVWPASISVFQASVVTSTDGSHSGAAAFNARDTIISPPGRRAFVIGRYRHNTGDIDLFIDGRHAGAGNSPTHKNVRRGRDGLGGGWTTGVSANGTLNLGKVRALFIEERAMDHAEIAALSERVRWQPGQLYFIPAAAGGGATAAEFSATITPTASFEAQVTRTAQFAATLVLDSAFEATATRIAEFAGTITPTASFAATYNPFAYFTASIPVSAAFEAKVTREAQFAASVPISAAFVGALQPADVTGAFSASLPISAAFEAILLREGQFAASIPVSAGFAATTDRVAEFAATVTVSATFIGEVTNTLRFSASIPLSAGFQAEATRTAEFAASIGISASFSGGVPVPSWTPSNFDSTHLITDGPRIISNVLSWAFKSSSGNILEGGFGSTTTGSGQASNTGTTLDIMVPCYCEFEQVAGPSGNVASQFGIVPNSFSPGAAYFSESANCVAYWIDGAVKKANTTVQTYTARVATDIGMMAFNPTSLKIWFGLNGTWNGDPAAGTGEAATMGAGTYRVMVSTGANNALDMRCNFGQQAWVHTPPAGFAGIGDFPS